MATVSYLLYRTQQFWSCAYIWYTSPREVIRYHINHQVHSAIVQSRGKVFEILYRAKLWIDVVQVILPVAMISWRILNLMCNLGQCQFSKISGLYQGVLQQLRSLQFLFENLISSSQVPATPLVL